MFKSPSEAFSNAADALRRGEWARAATCCDPLSLAVFKSEILEHYRPPGTTDVHRITAEDYMRADPSMPAAVADYHVSRQAQRPDVSTQIRSTFPGFSAYEDLENASPPAVFAAWLHGRSMQYQVEKAAARGQLSPSDLNAALAEAGREYTFVVLGTVPEGGQLAHVVYREQTFATDSEAESLSPETLSPEQEVARDMVVGAPLIATCRKDERKWHLVAKMNFLSRSAGGWFGYAPGADEH